MRLQLNQMYISEDQPGLFQEPAKQSNGSHPPDPQNPPRTRIKNYVLDTNVLLHDPHSVYRFADNHVWIPIDVLSELDQFKNEQTERGANARTVHRFLSRCFNQNSKLVMRGAKTPEGGTVRVVVNEFLTAGRMSRELRRFHQIFRDLDKTDNRILALCLYVKSKRTDRTILVTKDLNMQLKALAIGLEAQDYENDKVEVADVEGYGHQTIEIDSHLMQRFASSRELSLERKDADRLQLNEYIFLSAGDNKLMPARYIRRTSPLLVPHIRRVDGQPPRGRYGRYVGIFTRYIE
jgi:PhoH-like ATPase